MYCAMFSFFKCEAKIKADESFVIIRRRGASEVFQISFPDTVIRLLYCVCITKRLLYSGVLLSFLSVGFFPIVSARNGGKEGENQKYTPRFILFKYESAERNSLSVYFIAKLCLMYARVRFYGATVFSEILRMSPG